MNDSSFPPPPTGAPGDNPGLRGRIKSPRPPAPVPEAPRTPAHAPTDTQSDRSRLRRAPQAAQGKPQPAPGVSTGSTTPRAAATPASVRPAATAAAGTATAAVASPDTAGTGSATASPKAAAHAPAKPTTATAPHNNPADGKASDKEVVRAGGSMAIATLVSRITGFIRTVLIGSSLGGAVASAFNVANTLPNLITEIVLGAVLTSLVVPVLVRAQKEDADGGAAFVRRLFTLSLSILGVITVAAVIGAPWLTEMMLSENSKVNVSQSTAFAYLLLPQIVFYGLFSLLMAVLNTQGVFKPGAWAPVVNNLISIAVLVAYGVLPGSLNPAATAGVFDPHVLLLGLGMTAGVVAQLLIMLPPLRRAGISLKPLWGIDARLKQFGGMALAIIIYVAISQYGYVITTRIAASAHHSGPLIYQNHWLLLQMPYGIIGVTLLTAIMPRLSRNAADGDHKGVVRDLTLATKLTLIALVPIVIFFTAFGPEIGPGLFQYWNFSAEDAHVLGLTLSFAAFTLIPYALVLLHLRVFYAREEAWTPTFIIAGITATKVVLSWLAPHVASSPSHVVILLGAANGFGFIAGAVIGIYLLRRKLGALGLRSVARTCLWAVAASIVGLAAALCAKFLLGIITMPVLPSLHSFGTLINLGILGTIFIVTTAVVLMFSKLPEVTAMGGAFARIPGLRRFVTPETAAPTAPVGITKAEQAEATAYIGMESFAATPVPPPMSAGVVRGPRLIPGAPVADGRFRLLSDEGSVPGARFWQAQDRYTGRLVSLTFVDTSGTAPLALENPVAIARRAAEVTTRTRTLATLHEPGIATGIEVHAYRSGCLVVADWVDGLPLRTVAEQSSPEAAAGATGEVDPRAAAHALAPLAQAIGAAHASHLPLGLDNWARIRINTDGEAVLAFPAVLPENTQSDDLYALATAANLLIGENAPADVLEAKLLAEQACAVGLPEVSEHAAGRGGAALDEGAAAVAEGSAAEVPGAVSPAEIAAAFAAAGAAGEEPGTAPEHLAVEPQQLPRVKAQPGFGARGYTRRGTWLLAAGAVAAVVLVAIATTYLTGVLSGDSRDAPVTTDSLQSAGAQPEEQLRDPIPLIQGVASANLWEVPGYDAAKDNPGELANAFDGDLETTWTSGSYPNGLGSKPGFGVRISLHQPVDLRYVVINAEDSRGAHYSIYALPEGLSPAEAAALPLDELPRISDGTLTSGRTNAELGTITHPTGQQVPARSDALLLWFSALPKDTEAVTLKEVQVVGQR